VSDFLRQFYRAIARKWGYMVGGLVLTFLLGYFGR
jgi:hypothetical protein